MPSIIDRCKGLWRMLQESPAERRTRFRIPLARVDVGDRLKTPFKPDGHYFQVRVNEMWLAKARQWFSQVDPMVAVISEFIYDKQQQAVPFVVGPSLMQRHGIVTPAGMEYADTRVAGLHPYRGGRLTLSVILFQVARSNHARDLLRLLERTAGAIDFSTALGSYLSIADVILDGIESVMGLTGSQPCLGLRMEIDPDAKDSFQPGYYALIDLPDKGDFPSHLWVRENRLMFGESLETAKPFREADFILYCISQENARSDLRTLPFYPTWERVQREAQQGRPVAWRSAKANLVSLCQAMRLSPDLTEPHCAALIEEFKTKAKQRYDEAIELARLGSPHESQFEQIRNETLTILDL